jgi:hypothetical protein
MYGLERDEGSGNLGYYMLENFMIYTGPTDSKTY